MAFTRMKNLQINDIFIDPHDGEVYQVEGFRVKKVINPEAPTTVEIKVKVLKGSAEYPFKGTVTYNARFQCEYLRPGDRNMNLIQVNAAV